MDGRSDNFMDGRLDKNFSVTDIRAALKPTKAIPIDARCMFSSLEAAQKAAATAVAVGGSGSNYYIGQKLCVYDYNEDEEVINVSWYTIGRDKKLHREESSVFKEVRKAYEVTNEGIWYDIVFVDETGAEKTSSFFVPKGEDGKDGSSLYTVKEISKASQDKKGVVYNMIFSDGMTHQFTVFTPYVNSEDGHWYVGGVDLGTQAVGLRGEPGKDGKDGEPGKDGKDGSVYKIYGFYSLGVKDNNDLVVYCNDKDETKIPNFRYDKENGDLFVEIGENVETRIGNVKGKDGATIKAVEYVESDDNGNYVYRMTFSDGSAADFTVPIAGAQNKVDKKENKSTQVFTDKIARDAVYSVDTQGVDALLYTSPYRNPNTVVVRDGRGGISVNDPQSNYDAANKHYVDAIATTIAEKFADSISFRVESDGTIYLITED